MSPANRLRESATRLRSEAARLDALADAIDGAGVPKGARLSGRALAAANAIRRTPGMLGDEVADAIGVVPVTFRKHVVPKLRAAGFTNRGGNGGYDPPAGKNAETM